MRIMSVAAKPPENILLPSILFEVEIGQVKYGEAIIGISGWLETDDGKIVAHVNEGASQGKRTSEVAARGSFRDNMFREEKYQTILISTLDKTALVHIENSRMKEKKGDVNFTLTLVIKYAGSQANIFTCFSIDPTKIGFNPIPVQTSAGVQKGEILAYAYDSRFSSSYTNRWIISGNGSPAFLSLSDISLKTAVRIPSNDWLHDYAPRLSLGEYFIVEIPKGRELIEQAWKYVNTAEECLRRWDTKGAFANCREVGYLFDRLIRDKFGSKSFACKELWGRTYQRFERLASLDLHVEDLKKSKKYAAEEVKIGREETEHIILLTKALTKYAEELLERRD